MTDQSGTSNTADWQAKWWDLAKSARQAQIDYGRWIVNTLWLMHSGAVAGLLAKWGGNGAIPYKESIGFFIAGIVFAFATASNAWLNFTISSDIFLRFTYAGERWSSTDVEKHWKWLKASMYVAILCVCASILCLIVGAGLVIAG
jgi:hypothetical protein